jgi:hypothetical protein
LQLNDVDAMMKKFVVLVGLMISQSIDAQNTVGNSFPSAVLSFSPVSIATGGNLISHPNSQLGLYMDNPALLDSSAQDKIQVSYLRYLAKSNASQCFYARHKKGSKFTSAYGIKYLGFGDLTRYDDQGTYLGDFRAYDASIKAVCSYALDTNWTIGASTSTVVSQLDNNSMWAQTFDLGAHYFKRKGDWTFDVLVKNIGFKWGGSGNRALYEIPNQWLMGFSKKPKNAPFRWMVTLSQMHELRNPATPVVYSINEPKWVTGDQLMRRATVGTEVLLGNVHFLAGYNYQRRADLRIDQAPGLAGISMGVGVFTQRWQLVYAWSRYHTASSIHGIQLIFQPFSAL